jgi:hypothetical protein
MRLRPIPSLLSRPLSVLIVLAWLVQMGYLLRRTLFDRAPVALAAELSRYGSEAHWRGIYYRGEKIGFSVSQTVPRDDGYEIQEDGQLQMVLLGVTAAPVRVKTSVRVDRAFALRSFAFSLDPGTGALSVEGALEGLRLSLAVKGKMGSRSEVRQLEELPSLSLNLSRLLAAQGLAPGKRVALSMFDPATLRNAPMQIHVLAREVLRVEDGARTRPVPVFKVETQFAGIKALSWITETGEVLREESPMGLIVVREPREKATAYAVSREIQVDMYEAAAVVPNPERRIDDPGSVDFLSLRLAGFEPTGADLQGAGQRVTGDLFELRDAESLPPEPAEPGLESYLKPELFLESDAPEIVAEAQRALEQVKGPRARAERLVRHVNALLEKRPTVSLPSAAEVLRTRVGDCNEHTALYVALARAAGLPARIALGLVHLRGAFYYHAWPEVWIGASAGRGRWVPVDPTLNQFPADLTHVRLVRGGLDRQAAIVAAMGRLRMQITELRMRPGTAPILVGRPEQQARPIDIPIPTRDGSGRGCWSRPS